MNGRRGSRGWKHEGSLTIDILQQLGVGVLKPGRFISDLLGIVGHLGELSVAALRSASTVTKA
jgi:hypothetical protein